MEHMSYYQDLRNGHPATVLVNATDRYLSIPQEHGTCFNFQDDHSPRFRFDLLLRCRIITRRYERFCFNTRQNNATW